MLTAASRTVRIRVYYCMPRQPAWTYLTIGLVSTYLLVQLTSPRRLRGHARLLEGGKELEFGGAEELAKQVDNPAHTPVIATAGEKAASLRKLRAEWPAGSAAVWDSRDLAYLFGLPVAQNLVELEVLAKQALSLIQAIDDDLLAQLCLLVQEQAAQQRLGFLVDELYRRHDPLSIPAAGEVELARYFPPSRELGALSRQDLPSDLLERLFSARESLSRAFDTYEDRPQQLEMCQAVEQALSDGRPLVVEAGTGVGKSLAYLLPLAVHSAQSGQLCLISTNTLNLQQQLIEQDIPRLARILDTLELRITLLKGREHYLCLKRLKDTWLRANPSHRQRLMDGGLLSEAALLFLLRLLLQYAGEPDLDFSDIPSAAGLWQAKRQQLLHSIDCRFQTCLGDRCELKGHCHYFSRRAAAQSSHLVITNHALVFSLYDPTDSDADNVVSRAAVIVFDEAHNLQSVITNQKTLELSHQMPVELGNRLLEVLGHEALRKRLTLDPASVDEVWREKLGQIRSRAPEVGKWIKLGVEIREQVNQLLAQASEKGHLADAERVQLTPPTATGGQQRVLGLLAKLAARMHAVIEQMGALAAALKQVFGDEEGDLYVDDDSLLMELQSLSIDLAEAGSALANWRPEDVEAITWFNCEFKDDEPAWEYKTAPLDVGPVFQGLMSAKECTVLCSATLTVAGRFDFLQESLGFDEATTGLTNWLRLSSPFDYKSQSRLYLATDLAAPTGPSRDSYLAQLEQVVAGVCGIFERGVLVLFNSYRDLNHIAERLPFHVDYDRILVQGFSGTRAEIAERFRTAGDKVLLATRSFWEGFDVAGEALSCVVLAKLPFANFKDPIHAGRQQAITAAGGDSFRSYSLPLAAMQLKQGFGRLVRTTTDKGCVFLLDSRAAKANYGKVFIQSLPDPTVVTGGYQECLEDAAAFMAQPAGGDSPPAEDRPQQKRKQQA